MITPLLALAAAATLLWAVSVARRDVSIVDVFWGPAFAMTVGLAAYERAESLDPLRAVLVLMVALWGLRLGVYLGWRNLVRDRARGEDRRYQAIRARWDPGFWWKSLFIVFLGQAALVALVALPVLSAIGSDVLVSPAHPGVVAGVALFAVGLFFETVGDLQLARFVGDPANAGKVMNRGLWRYTRHPNYFGDFCVWWGLFVTSSTLGAPWWSVVAPLTMTVLLLRVSGVALLESDIASRRPGYAEYVRSTSAFFPRPPRR